MSTYICDTSGTVRLTTTSTTARGTVFLQTIALDTIAATVTAIQCVSQAGPALLLIA